METLRYEQSNPDDLCEHSAYVCGVSGAGCLSGDSFVGFAALESGVARIAHFHMEGCTMDLAMAVVSAPRTDMWPLADRSGYVLKCRSNW